MYFFMYLITNIVVTICYAIIALYNSFGICVQTLSAEKAFTSIQRLAIPLNKSLIGETRDENIQDVKLLAKEIENIPPLSGNGYFEIRKGTISSIVSNTVTYLIILLQFRTS